MTIGAAGKGIVRMPPAVWYNRPWPEYNARLLSGGSRAPERIGEFTVHDVPRVISGSYQTGV